ncbi:MAG TPA: DUF2800 domain-containing protein [Sedimentisphaerales bacterium]|nr:DUF2800 domain-containing protein [Sedimentisphaerales bacterium]
MNTNEKHAVLSASSSKRWMSCPGSIRMCAGAPATEGPYAREGTVAHRMAEMLLKDGKYTVDGLALREGEDYALGEMCQAVMVYVNYVSGLCRMDVKYDPLVIEARFDLSCLYPGMYGTNDASVYDHVTRTLHVIDYKHGKGVLVDPENNTQLMYYATGALLSLSPDRPVERVVLTVVQPRAARDSESGILHWETTPESILHWAKTELVPAAKRTEDPNAPLVVGDHCRFCPALGTCPAQAQRAIEIAQMDFATLTPKPAGALSEMDTAALARVVLHSDLIRSWLQAAEAALFTRAMNGEALGGHGLKLVAKRSNRKWKAGAEDELKAKYGTALLEAPALCTVPAAEKKLRALNLDPKALAQWIEKPDNGLVLAPADDKRPEVHPGAPAAEDFLDSAEFLK